MAVIRVCLKREVDDSYDIEVGQGLLEGLPREIASLSEGRRYAIICDANTERLFARDMASRLSGMGVECQVLAVPAGEASKSLSVFEDLLVRLRSLRFTRSDAILAVGGGVVGDLAGFTAGCYMRSIPFYQIPTTLLSQVDSSVGGKVAVNIREGKNYCGLFYQPEKVWIDTKTLFSLPAEELRCGLAEVVKYAVIRDPALFGFLERKREAVLELDSGALEYVVTTCCAIKADVVERDEREGGLRRILNYGHTIGHAIEQAMDYSMGHGRAVAYGMKAAASMAVAAGLLAPELRDRQDALIDAYGLAGPPLDLDAKTLIDLAAGDKKATRKGLVFVLPRDIGEVDILDDVDPAAVRAGVEAVLA